MKSWIKKEDWYTNRYAKVDQLENVYQLPESPHPQKNQLQTQVEESEVVKLLGQSDGFCLIEKYDGTLGWIREQGCNEVSNSNAVFRLYQKCSGQEFFQRWQGTPYLWGGVTTSGIDCSGLIQRYYTEVHGYVLPKNSRNQRKLGESVEIESVRDEDLIFVLTRQGTHHVGIFFEDQIWHANSQRGVIPESLEVFLNRYQLEDGRRLFLKSLSPNLGIHAASS